MRNRKFVNGSSTPKFTIKNNDTIINTIILDLTDENGLVEEYEFYSIKHQLLNYSNIHKTNGFHINFSLPYSSYSAKENLLKIKLIINYFIQGTYQVYLTPRSDFNMNTYEVVMNMDTMQMGLLKGGQYAVGNRLVELGLKTKYIQTTMNWFDLDDLYITIDDFVSI